MTARSHKFYSPFMRKFILTSCVLIFVIGCQTTQKMELPPLNVFREACISRLNEKKFQAGRETEFCDKAEQTFFTSTSPIQDIEPSRVGAPVLPIDSSVKFITFYDSKYLSALAYCYFQFRGWFDPKVLSPADVAKTAAGFAILKSELSGYQEWMDLDTGKACAQRVHDSLGVKVISINQMVGNLLSVIAFNPVGAIRSDSGLDGIIKEAQLTLNHERIHAMHVSCPHVDRWAKSRWRKLSKKEKEALKNTQMSYDWSNKTVAVRESLAYAYENNPTEVLKHIKSCKFK